MRTIFLTVATGLAVAGWSAAYPELLFERTVSPDETCGDVAAGANNSYTCDASVNLGGCCSQYGYCGNTTDYCGIGCQTAFGSGCLNTTTSSDVCGATNDNAVCTSGCCSQYGYCGTTDDYCGDGCQPDFGTGCTTNSTAPTGGSGGLCGPDNDDAVCDDNQCCSLEGYCGTSEDYCSDPANCQLSYGRCDSDATPTGPTTINVPRPLKGPVTYDDDIIDCIEDNIVALSFDDGPYIYTSELLDTLASYGFHATFFITGNNNGKGQIDITDPYPALLQRMIADGHQVASHTWSHYDLNNITSDLRIQQMVKNEMAFNNIIGKWPTYMRPPYSDCTADTGCQADLKSLGYHRIYFDLDTQDYLNPLPTQIQASKDIVQQALEVQGVTDYLSIQHDIVEQSVTNLSAYYFDLIKNMGWTGVTVAECLGDTDVSNWYRTINDTAT